MKVAMSATARKRKQRESMAFKNKEKEIKRKKREDIDFRNKEKEKKVIKRREDIDLRNKERGRKRKRREDIDFRNKENDRRKIARRESSLNFPREAELQHGDRKKIHAANVARYRLKRKCCTGGRYSVESPFENECQRLFRQHLLFDLKFTRYENKAYSCLKWMMDELISKEKKVLTMTEDLLERELDAIRKRGRLKKTDSDERLCEEGASLFTDIYAKISAVGCVINAVRERGRKSFRILKLGTEIIDFFRQFVTG